MRTPLVLKNLFHSPVRTSLSVAGVGLSTVLIFLQLGFLGAVQTTATLIYDQLEFDVMLRSPDYLHLCDARQIPKDRLLAVESLPIVKRVTPFHVALNHWQHPTKGESNAIIVMGCGRGYVPVADPELRANFRDLQSSTDVLIDRTTHRDFGPANGEQFGDEDIGVTTDVGGAAVEIAGHFELGTGLAAKGALFTTEHGFNRLSLYDPRRLASLGLVKLAPGADVAQAIPMLRQAVGDDRVDVLSRAEVERLELERWVSDTPIGKIFQMGVAIAFLVGATIVYMVLSTDVTNRLAEYATLSAMGYSQNYMSRLVMQQALLLAVAGYLPAWLVAELLYWLTATWASIPVSMTGGRLLFVFMLAVVMCSVSGFLALGKLRKADPADLF